MNPQEQRTQRPNTVVIIKATNGFIVNDNTDTTLKQYIANSLEELTATMGKIFTPSSQ